MVGRGLKPQAAETPVCEHFYSLSSLQAAASFVITTPGQQMGLVLIASPRFMEHESEGQQRKLLAEPRLKPQCVHLLSPTVLA